MSENALGAQLNLPCLLLLCGYDVPVETVQKISPALHALGFVLVHTHQYVFGDLSDDRMKSWARQARPLRVKLEQALSVFPDEQESAAIYTQILIRAYELVLSQVNMHHALVVSIPSTQSGACSIFSTMCEKLSERGVMVIGTGIQALDEVHPDLQRDLYRYIPLTDTKTDNHAFVSSSSYRGSEMDTNYSQSLRLAPSSVAPSTVNHASSLAVDVEWNGTCIYPTAVEGAVPAAIPLKSPDPAGCFPRAVGAPAPSLTSESVRSTSTVVATAALPNAQRNQARLLAYLTKKLEARGGPPYAALSEVVGMAERMPHPAGLERAIDASDFGDFRTLEEVIGSMSELVVDSADHIESSQRTAALTVDVLASGIRSLTDSLVVRLSRRPPSLPLSEASDDASSLCRSHLDRDSSSPTTRHGERPMENFSKYVPLATHTKLVYYPVALALFNALHVVRQTLKHANTLPSSGTVPLSQVIQHIVTHYPAREYHYKTYGFGKATGLLSELTELFRVSQGPDSLPHIMWVHDAPRRLAWMQIEYKKAPPSLSANRELFGPQSGARIVTATPAARPVSASEQQAQLKHAKEVLIKAITSLNRESPTGGVEGFLPSVIVARAGALTGTPFDPKAYGHTRLKSLVSCFSDSISWFQKGSVDYVRLIAPHENNDATHAKAAPATAPRPDHAVATRASVYPDPTPAGIRKPTYREALDPPPPYGVSCPPPPLGGGCDKDSDVLMRLGDQASDYHSDDESTEDADLYWVCAKQT